MMTTSPLRGALAPVVTPYAEDLAPDARRLAAQCRRLIDQDCGLAVFGTNSEGNSLSVEEKIELLDALMESGLPAERMMPGTGHCALSDTVRLTRHAVGLGCAGVLMLPPFYYKGVSDEGIFRAIAEAIERVGDPRLRVYLYHFPQMAVIGFSLPLIARLIDAYPGVVVGIKDSSGDWENTRAMLERFPGWGVFPGNELRLQEALRLGAAGCISATCNVNAANIADLCRNWQAADAEARQARLNQEREVVARYPLVPALKAIVARELGDPGWERLRPPLMPLTAEQKAALFAELDAVAQQEARVSAA
jgi:4-hydroxy-tetrahydrodipicolinate synthase